MQKVTIGAKLRPSYAKKLEEIAKSKEKTKSELVREIVENYVDMHL